ncbi:hypothetical protein M8C21_023045, partial [Ambrosia artemisiifolia]
SDTEVGYEVYSNGDHSSLSLTSNSSNISLKSSNLVDVESSMYKELWHACAGPLTTLPNKGNVVVYFPQGHLEQMSTQSYVHLSTIDVPSLGLKPHIFCKVVDVQLLANKDNDEIYTKLRLLPLPEFTGKNLKEGEEEEGGGDMAVTKSTPQMFCKTLTASDTSSHGGFSVPRRAAEDCFPPLVERDYKQQRPNQELVAKDLHGVEWKFRHIYRGQPRRHLLTTGWSIFVSQKNLVSGDAVLFLSVLRRYKKKTWSIIVLRGKGGELRLGTRRATRPRIFLPETNMPNSNSFMEILAPVRWDEDVGNNNQERISPWEIDLSGVSMPLLSMHSSLRFKKLRTDLHSTPSEHHVAAWGGCFDFEESTRSSKVLQGQENIVSKMNNSLRFGAQPSMHAGKSANIVTNPNTTILGSNNTRFPTVLQGQEICSLKSLAGDTNGPWGPPRADVNIHQRPKDPGYYPLGLPVNQVVFGNGLTKDHNIVNGLKLQLQAPVDLGKTTVDRNPIVEGNSGSEKDDGGSDSNGSSCKLFGFQLNEAPPQMEDSQILSKRSCTKVHKQGNKVGRAIDLSKMSSYHELHSELESLFQMEGVLTRCDGAWRLLYTDKENDIMVVGDDPWDEFARMATKIHICSMEEVEKLMSGGVISDDTSCLEEAPAVVDTAKSSPVGKPE